MEQFNEPRAARPRVLVVGDSEEVAHDVVRALEASEYLMVHVTERGDAAFAARHQHPEAVVLVGRAADASLLELCRSIRDDGMSTGVPILLASPVRPRREDEIAAIVAGVWCVCVAPIDMDQMRARIELFAAARRESARASAASLVDTDTGLYNAAGLARRGRELESESTRRHSEMGLIALAAEIDTAMSKQAVAKCGETLRRIGRPSDIVGRLGPTEFLVLAPATGSVGARRLARRFAAAFANVLRQALPPSASVRVRAGFTALPNLAYSPVEPGEIVSRATSALRIGSLAPDFEWLSAAEMDSVAATA